MLKNLCLLAGGFLVGLAAVKSGEAFGSEFANSIKGESPTEYRFHLAKVAANVDDESDYKEKIKVIK